MSVLGPLLWNIAFDVVLRLSMPKATITIGFADDKLIMAKEGTIFEVEGHDITALCVALECIRGLGLELAVEKIQAVMFTRQ